MDKLTKLNIFKKGAEANIYLSYWQGKEVILKSRNVKKYRHSILDKKIRRFRTIRESQLINEAKKAGVTTPLIFLVDIKNMIIVMEFIRGIQVKHILAKLTIKDRKKLIVQSKEGMSQRFNLDIRNFSEVVEIDRENKEVVVLNRQSNEKYRESYDKLILSPGAKPIFPNIDGINDADNLFTLRNIPDTDKIYKLNKLS